ncbi:MAG: hypothetical protein ACI8TX_000746 [Hyphomicrobiaceae bacterium]|jgi:hypothetical protein
MLGKRETRRTLVHESYSLSLNFVDLKGMRSTRVS